MKRLMLALIVVALLYGCDYHPDPFQPPNQSDILKCAFRENSDACKGFDGQPQ